MSTWKEIQQEIAAAKNFDIIRRQKYANLVKLTGRNLLVYATAFLYPQKAIGSRYFAIDLSDVDGFVEITNKLPPEPIDIMIHSPGGSAEATESIVRVLRSKFPHIRFIVTGVAKSAATMLALSGDEILMTNSAELGPIDPQIRVKDRFSPAGSIIEQFDAAKEALREDPESLPAWIPILQEFAPSLMIESANYIDLAHKLVTAWMIKYMFKDEKDAKSLARKIADYLTNEKVTLSHARRVDYSDLNALNARVQLIDELNEDLRNAINDVHLALSMTLQFSDAVKIFENSKDDAKIISIAMQPNGKAQPAE